MNRLITFATPTTNTKNLLMVVVWDNGTYQLFHPREIEDDEGYAAIEWWRDERYHLDEGAWRACAGREATTHETIFVRTASYGDPRAYAAERAAQLAGMEIPKLDRHADGYFRCPHCEK